MIQEGNSDTTEDLFRTLQPSKRHRETLLRYVQTGNIDNRRIFSEFLKVLTDLEMPEGEAKFHVGQIKTHTAELEAAAGREVGFCVGMLDYLLNINPRLECPKIIELRDYNNMLAQSTIDGLTGVYNRRYFDKQLENELQRARRHNQTFSLLMMDIDDFKKVNDIYGHTAGDQILKEFSGLIKNLLRTEDIAARYGGEEFAVILPQTDIEGGKVFADRLLDYTRTEQYTGGIAITFSGGLSNYPHHAATAEELIEIADKGLYDSKLKGKDQVTVLPAEERRDTMRYRTEDEIYFATEPSTIHSGMLENISLSGLAGTCTVNLKPGDIITLKSDYDINAKIVWSYADSRDTRFGVRYQVDNRNSLYKLLSHYVPPGSRENEFPQPDLF